MAKDILHRLRNWNPLASVQSSPSEMVDAMVLVGLAADEIERLRDDLARARLNVTRATDPR